MKSVYRTTPVSIYDIQGLEHWLEEQAGAGLFPHWITGDFTVFHRSEATPGTRFQLEAANGREAPEPERLELYRQAGWEYISTVGKIYFLFYTSDSNTPELHTDPVTRGLSLEWLARHVKSVRRNMRIWRALILGILTVGAILVWRMDARRLPLMLLDMCGLFAVFLLLFFCAWWDEERQYRLLLNLQASLELGVTPRLSRPKWWGRAAAPLGVLLLLLLAGDRLYQKPIPLNDFSHSYVNLQQLESEPVFSYEELLDTSSAQDWNRSTVTRHFSFLAPSYYEVKQNLFSPGSFSPSSDPERRYSPSLDAVYFRLTIPALARTIAMSELAKLELVNLPWTYEELEYPGLDLAVLARNKRDNIWQMAAVAKGGRVAVFRYGGQENLANHLDVLAEAVT